jgi:hypothetical protein
MYKGRSIIGEQGKRMFNTLVTGLSMALGITVASSFKNVALDIRLWILSRKKRSIEEASSLVKRTRELITKSEAERRAGQRALQRLTSLPRAASSFIASLKRQRAQRSFRLGLGGSAFGGFLPL